MSVGGILRGMTILIVEDEPLIASDIESAVMDVSGIVLGPASTLAAAFAFAEADDLDGAIVDLHLKDDVTTHLVERLIGRHIPVIVHTGSFDPAMARRWPDVSWVSKPADIPLLVATLADRMSGRRATS